MVYFKKSFITFFKKLSNNNNNDWFKANESIFESEVNTPFHKLILDLIENIHALDSDVRIQPIDAIYKICKNKRSISYNESPYNNCMSAYISKYGRKTMNYPGTYIKIDTKSILLRFGLLECDPLTLEKVRDAIVLDYESLYHIISHHNFKNYFGKVRGSQSIGLDEKYKNFTSKYPLILNNQFYCEVQVEISLITAGKLLDLIIQHYKIAKPFNDYLVAIIKS